MEAKDALGKLETGDKITINGNDTILTVAETMFDGEMIDLEGPRGGEKSIVQNVNNPDQISYMVRNNRKEWVSEITVV